MTRAEMYQAVRETLAAGECKCFGNGDDSDIVCNQCFAVDTLDALEAEERDEEIEFPLLTELRQAVDAMRPFAKWVIEQDDPRGRSHFVRYADCVPVAESGGVNATFGDFRKAEDIVTDYDAKHGGKA